MAAKLAPENPKFGMSKIHSVIWHGRKLYQAGRHLIGWNHLKSLVHSFTTPFQNNRAIAYTLGL